MKRIAIIGLPGSGKSTFATRLGKKLNIPVHHLDTHMFNGNVKRDREEFLAVKEALVKEDSWIIEGCSLSTLEMRFARADTVIYFQLPRLQCIWRICKRLFTFNQADAITGCLNGINWTLIKYIWNFERDKGQDIENLRKKYPQVHFIVFHTASDVEEFLASTYERVDHADNMVAVVYKITKPNGQNQILKICPRIPDFQRELFFLKLLDGKLPVPKIIKTNIKTIEPNAILMECLPGHLLTDLTDDLAYEIGATLAKIHMQRTSGYGDPMGDLNDDPRIYFSMKFAEGLEECRSNLPSSLLEKCDQYFKSHLDLLKNVDGPCVVHRDFRPGNLMIDQGKLQGVIDWAGARFSFAEEDFCNPFLSKPAFLSGYASVRPVPNYSTLMPLLLLNKAIASIGFTVKTGMWNSVHASLYQTHRQFLENFFE